MRCWQPLISHLINGQELFPMVQRSSTKLLRRLRRVNTVLKFSSPPPQDVSADEQPLHHHQSSLSSVGPDYADAVKRDTNTGWQRAKTAKRKPKNKIAIGVRVLFRQSARNPWSVLIDYFLALLPKWFKTFYSPKASTLSPGICSIEMNKYSVSLRVYGFVSHNPI